VVDAQGHNIFSQPDGAPSPLLGHFIAGLQRYVPELMLMFAPNVNSYRRYVAGSQAPINLHWGHDNRTAGLRVPASSAAARRVENRVAGADANPYLAIAASLAAGLAGIEQGLEPTPALAGNGYDQSCGLPLQMTDAIQKMQHSALARQALGDDFVTGYTAVKALEFEHFSSEISAWERRYLLAQV